MGTIIEAPMLTVRLVRRRPVSGASPGRSGRALGQIEEYFIEQLVPGDIFLFAGKVLRFEGLMETEVMVTATRDDNPAIPSYYGGKFPLSTYLASQVRHMLASPQDWHRLPTQVSEWLRIQQRRSVLPRQDGLLVETFPRRYRGAHPAPFPGHGKSGRQVTFSSDLIYDVLREHEPDHILLQATHDDAAAGILDVARVGDMLARVQGRITVKRLERVSPLAVPVLLDIGKETVSGDANEVLLAEAADSLIEEATRLV